jgi:signal transduction histidine kinase
LRDISEKLVSREVPFSVLCDQIVNKCIEIFDAQACSLYVENRTPNAPELLKTITMVAGAGYEGHRFGQATYTKGQGLTGSIWERGEPVRFDSAKELRESGVWSGVHDQLVLDREPSWVFSSLIGVPLRIGDRVIGVIKVENKNPGPPAHFSDEELRTLHILAGNIALALDLVNWHRELFSQGDKARQFLHDAEAEVKIARSYLATVQALGQLAAADVAEGIVEGISRANKSLENVLAMKQKADSAVPGRATIFDARQLVREFLVPFEQYLHRERGIRLATVLPAEPLFVNADRVQVMSALRQILWNAVEALTGAPDPTIAVSASLIPATRQVAITVSNNGPALTKIQRESYKDQRFIPSTKQAGLGGSGIPEARRLCRSNHGSLELLDPPEGVAFQISLPHCQPSPLLLAIIDDSETVKGLFEYNLATRGDVRADYFSSLACLQEEKKLATMAKYDAILLDCEFNNCSPDGVEVYRDLMNRRHPLAARIILMSTVPRFLASGPIVRDKFTKIIDHLDDFLAELHGRWVLG